VDESGAERQREQAHGEGHGLPAEADGDQRAAAKAEGRQDRSAVDAGPGKANQRAADERAQRDEREQRAGEGLAARAQQQVGRIEQIPAEEHGVGQAEQPE
jgi:hypothetical protein